MLLTKVGEDLVYKFIKYPDLKIMSKDANRKA